MVLYAVGGRVGVWAGAKSTQVGNRLIFAVEILDRCAGLFGGLDELEDIQVAGRDDAFLRHRLEIDDAPPPGLAEQQHRDRRHLAGLN